MASPTGNTVRDALLAAAEELVTTEGGAHVGLREVARRAGVSHAAPGHIFGDKEGLLTALAASCFGRFGDHLERRATSEDPEHDALNRLAELGVAYVDFASRNWAIFEFMFRGDLVDTDDADYATAAARCHSVLADAVATAQANGWCSAGDHGDLTELCWALVHGLAGVRALTGAITFPAADSPAAGSPAATSSGENVAPDRERPDARPRSAERLIRLQLDALGR